MNFLEAFDFNKKTSLYIHIPFCKSKCSYCAFYSKVCSNEDIDLYFNKLILELDRVIDKLNGKSFYTVYIGGGNPGCLSVEQLEILQRKICANGRPSEFSIEMNPESLTERHFVLFEKGFTRLSMGVQSLDKKALSFLGRNADYEQTLRGIDLVLRLKEQTGCQISFDLITCLPTWHDYLADVKSIVEKYCPDHLSVYALTLEEGTPLFIAKPELPNSDRQFEILSDIWNYLESVGYLQYEVSNFARDGKISLHNSVYWDYEQYIGLGCAAASTGFADGCTFRIESACDIKKYISLSSFSCYDINKLSAKESLEEFVLMGLRHTKGLDLNRLNKEFGKTVNHVPMGCSIKNGFICPDKKGLMTADWAASELLSCIDS